jgi:signal peptidase II
MKRSLLKYFILSLVMLGGCNADYHTKKWAYGHLTNGASRIIVENVIDVNLAKNKGMIFGILNGKMPALSRSVLIAFRMLLLGVITILILMQRKKSFFFLFPFALLWAGAVGNLIDPFIYGYVVDFIHIRLGKFIHWPFYFNLADAFLTAGIGYLMIYFYVIERKCVQKSGA